MMNLLTYILAGAAGTARRNNKHFQTYIYKQFKKQLKIMIKKLYEKPTMKVVLLQHRAQLLAGSNGVDPLSPFAPGNDPLNP